MPQPHQPLADLARISVRDEGVGLPLNFETSKRVGLGMRLTSALVKQTDAKLRIERHARGTEFVLDVLWGGDRG